MPKPPTTLASLTCLLALLGTAAPTEARVARVDITRREPILDGKPFGLAGPYEKLVGTIHYAIDPANPRNQAIAGLDQAPRNPQGEVEFSADLFILKPKEPAKGNGTLLLEIPNRGAKGMLPLLDDAARTFDPETPEHFGAGFLLGRGFTLAWLGRQINVRPEPGRMRLCVPRALNPSDPAVVGFGLAAVRDLASYVKHDPGAVAPATHAIALGVARSGGFLQSFLEQGFNAGEDGRRALDAAMLHAAIAEVPRSTAVTGRVDELLDRARRDGVVPKVFCTSTSHDYWGLIGSLAHTTPDGKADLALPPEMRIYHLAGLRQSWTMRALVAALQDWVAGGVEPPSSLYPRIDDGTLVGPDTVQGRFPAILDREGEAVVPERTARGAGASAGLVPDLDGDGNDRSGIRLPQLEVPVATYTTWSLQDMSIEEPEVRAGLLGPVFPFPRTRKDREGSGDPRQSIDERYASFDEYLGRYTAAARRMVVLRYLLPEDLDAVLARGVEAWRRATEGFDKPLLTSADELDRLTVAPPPSARVSYGEAALEFGELRLPAGPGPHPVAIVIHGGCWLAEYDLAHARALSEALAEAGIAAWTIEYRRVGNPGGGWPGTFEDVARGADHLRVLARDWPLDLTRVIALGHSAGGQLALWLAARERLPAGSPLRSADPLRLRGVVGLAAAGDLAFVHERGVCGSVIDRLMGGSPAAVPDRYAAGSPAQLVPLGTRQILINGARDPFWSSVAARYIEAARAAGADLRVVEAPESGHFELIDPSSSTWPLVRDAALDLLRK